MKTFEPKTLATGVYERIKGELFDFGLLPGDRFTETEVAARVGVSRTPVREALYRLEREGYIDVSARNGWSVKPFDFTLFENLYDVRVVLELAAVRVLCEVEGEADAHAGRVRHRDLDTLVNIWLVPAAGRIRDPHEVCGMDEAFHQQLVIAAGNPEMARIHRDVSERIRIIRRLDFTKPERIDATYEEHGDILRAVMRRGLDEVQSRLRSHIEASKTVVRQITLHRLHSARTQLSRERRTA